MYRKGHYGINALLYAPFAIILGLIGHTQLILVCGIVFIGVARIPDFDRHFDSSMDTKRSEMWEYIPITHRGFTHTVWFATLTGGVSIGIGILLAAGYQMFVGNEIIVSVVSFAAGFGGITAHIIGDAITPTGVTPFSPLSKSNYSLRLCTADSTIWNNVFLIVGGITLFVAIGIAISSDIPTTVSSLRELLANPTTR